MLSTLKIENQRMVRPTRSNKISIRWKLEFLEVRIKYEGMKGVDSDIIIYSLKKIHSYRFFESFKNEFLAEIFYDRNNVKVVDKN